VDYHTVTDNLSRLVLVREFLAWWGTNPAESVFGYDAGRAHLTWDGRAPTTRV
jgi:hypothetical protein